MNKPFIVALTLIIAGTFVGVLLSGRDMPEQSQGDQIRVAATIFPIYDIVQRVAGDAAQVILIVPPGASPHTFAVTPKLIAELEDVDTVFSVGGIDEWVTELVDLTEVTEAHVDERVVRYDMTGGEAASHDDAGDDHDHDHDGSDPHYWLSVPNAIVIAETVADVMSKIDPGEAITYRENFEKLSSELINLDSDIRKELFDLPARNVVVMHDAWQYYAREYDLTVLASFQPSPGQEPLPRDIEELQKTVRDNQITTLFREPQISEESIQAIAKDLKIQVGVLDPLGGVPGRASYDEMMRYNTKTIADSLRSR